MTTKLKQYSVKIGAGTKANRTGSPVEGDIRYNTENKSYELYKNNAYGTDGWYGVGGRHLLARQAVSGTWSSLDLNWGSSNYRYAFYEVSCVLADPGSSNAYLQLRWRNDSGVDSGSDYGTAIGYHCANDGWDLAHQNNRLNSNPTSRHFISPTNGSYQLASTAEDHYHMQTFVANLPTNSHEQKIINGWYSYRSENRTGGGLFGGIYRQDQNSNTKSTNGGLNWWPITGCRIYWSTGNARDAAEGINAVFCAYGITGYEERDMG